MSRFFKIFIWISLSLLSCKDDACLKGSGDNTIEKRLFEGEIESLNVNNKLNVVIYPDSLNYLELSGGKNVLNHIESEQNGKELILSDKNECRFLRGFDNNVQLNLHLKSLNRITYSGSGNITMKDSLHTENFYFSSENGAGTIKLLINATDYAEIITINSMCDIHIFGKTNKLNLYNDGTSWIYSKEFESEEASVENRSTGDCVVFVNQNMKYSIKGIGNIQYKGKPEIVVLTKTGKGRLIPL